MSSRSSKKQDGSACHTRCAHGEDCWGQRAGNLSPASGPLGEAPLQGQRVGSNKPFAPQVYRPGFGGTTHGKGTTSPPEARKCFPWSAAGAGAGTLLLVHSRMAQVKANKTEANAKGLLDFLRENDPGIEARSKGEPLLGWGEETLRESELQPPATRPVSWK